MNGKIIIFKNKRKQKENHPDWVGTLEDSSGIKSDLALWIKSGKNGQFLAGQVKDQRQNENQRQEIDPDDQEFFL